MGKDRDIKILAKAIARETAHRILIKYTNKPESINHMKSEVIHYRGQSSELFASHNWNSNDKEKIKKESQKAISNELKKPHFNNVKYPVSEKIDILNEVLNGFFLEERKA